MEFEDEHDEELDEDEDDDDEDEITIPPPTIIPPPSYHDSLGHNNNNNNNNSAPTRPRLMINPERRSGVVRYRECLKNHAVNVGGHALDGCGEFMPAGDDGTLDALKCAACNCHRNFHRKEIDTTPTTPQPPHSTLYPHFSAYYRTPPPPPSGYLHVSGAAPHLQQHHHHHHHRPLAVVPSTSGGTYSGEMDDMSHPSSSGGGGISKKRFRTRFTAEQKDKMLGFAEKLGWRIQKHDELAVEQFCDELQIKRQVLKVWMHNNKHTHAKKP